jgi:hypothetical protein
MQDYYFRMSLQGTMRITMENVDQGENFGWSNLSIVRGDERCCQRFIRNYRRLLR